ncbi:cupin domain-containing protein [Shewanella sp. HL-SH5]|uniref:AraC family transcriptional regulator n=1 Tax=Shewanella sp. HL-SH5 TaxID=3436241 RepID=UPI003EBCB506
MSTLLLNSLLNQFHLHATIFHRSLVCDTWGTDTSGTGMASFHLISSGKAYLHTELYNGTLLTAGDMVIFPHDAPHIISFSPESSIASQHTSFIAYPIDTLAPANSTGLLCGYFDFAEDKSQPLIRQLPQTIVIKADEQQGALASLIQGLIDETQADYQGSEAIISRLTEVFFLALLRHLAKQQHQKLGFFNALQNPKMAKVLQAIHLNMAHNWSVNSMAETGGYSRASFASHFKQYFAISPMEYLQQLRLTYAFKQLAKGDSVLKVALDAGYQSDITFAKAYKRHFGFGPGATRAQVQTI